MFQNFIERTRAFVLGLPIRCDTHTLAQERAHSIAHNPSRTHHPSCTSGSAVTQSDKLAVIVENRRHPHLAYVVRRKTAHPKYARVARGCVALSRRRCLRAVRARMATLRLVLSAAARQRAQVRNVMHFLGSGWALKVDPLRSALRCTTSARA